MVWSESRFGHALATLYGHFSAGDRTVMNHLLTHRIQVTTPLWCPWFMKTLVLPMALNCHQLNSKDLTPFPPISQKRSAQVDVWVFLLKITMQGISTTKTVQTMKSQTMLCVCFHQQRSLASSPSLFSMHPQKMIPHLWVVKRPVSRWSAMAASSSLESLLSAAKIGFYHTQILLRDFLLPKNTSTFIITKWWKFHFIIEFSLSCALIIKVNWFLHSFSSFRTW